jgi:UDP-glucose 4-epimerase
MVQETLQEVKTNLESKEILEHYRDKKILITGGCGCIGSNLVRMLLKAEPERIAVLDDLSASYEWNLPKEERVIFIKGSILEGEVMKKGFSLRPDYVFHLAAHFANQNSVDHPETDFLVNGLGTLKVLEHANLVGVERFVFASSGCSVYGSQAPLPLKEDFVSLHLDTPYQMNKLVGELYCNFFSDYYRLPVAIARYFNVYGPGEVPGRYRNVIPNFMYWALNRKPLPITGTGEETRDFTFVDDIVDGTLRLGIVKEAAGEAFNLASETETRVIDLANWINELTGNKAGIAFKPRRDWDKVVKRRASIKKAKRVLGYRPQVGMKAGLKRVYEWILDNQTKIDLAVEF